MATEALCELSYSWTLNYGSLHALAYVVPFTLSRAPFRTLQPIHAPQQNQALSPGFSQVHLEHRKEVSPSTYCVAFLFIRRL